MSKRRLKRNACTKKKKYENTYAAFSALKRYNFPEAMRIYKCSFCGSFHVGHYNKMKSSILKRTKVV